MANLFVYESLSASAPAAGPVVDRELSAAGAAMRDAIVDDLLRLDGVTVTCAVGSARGRAAGGRAEGGRFANATPRAGEDPETFVGRMAATHDLCWIVAPETGGQLARLQSAVGEERWIGCDAAALRCASSKRATLAVLAAAGVPTPLDGAASHRGRWVVKPDDGAGCLATQVHADLDAARSAIDAGRRRGHRPEPTLEPFVDGEALSVSAIVGPELARTVSFNRQRIAIDGKGRLRDLGVQPAALDVATDPRIARLEAVAAATLRALPGLGGFVGIDMVWHEQRGAVVIEVNPRVTCAYVGLSRKLGRNLAADILNLKAPGALARASRDDIRA